jgi:NAD-dependent dihydropyrimidine dehydrogenase PreA subunit/flavodoxin
MKITIFQFSGTGNTWYAAQHLQKAFEAKNVSCKVMSIESLENINEAIESADIIGLGYPIYGSDMPEIVHTFLSKISSSNHKQAFVFCTQYMFSGDGANVGAKVLRKKGFKVRQLMHFNMPNNITDFPVLRKLNFKNEEKLKLKLTRKAKRFTEDIIFNRRLRKGELWISLLLGLIQRIPFRQGREKFKASLKIDDTCIGCGRCVELCPSDNIKIIKGKAIPDLHCYLCYRCVNYCPVQAIHFAKHAKIINPYHGPYKEFNIDDVKEHQVTTKH